MSQDANYALESNDAQQEIPAPDLAYRPQFPKSSKLEIGLIGCGGITTQHLTAYRNAGLNVIALCDRISENAEARKQEFFPHARIYTDPAELLANNDIRVVDLALHPEPRAEWMEAALQAGKHVLSQKPFVIDINRGERLVRLAEEQSCLLAVNQNGRWAPCVRYAQLAIDEGLIGRIQSVSINVCWDHGWVAGTPFEKIHHLLLYDFAVHWIDMVCCFMKRPARSANAMLARSTSQNIVPSLIGSGQLAFDNGIASLHFDGSTKFGAFESIQIIGAKGRISARGKPLEAHQLEVITSDGIARPKLEGQWMPDGFGGTMGELLCAIEENRQPYNSASNNLRSLEAVFALIASADEGRVVRVGEARRLGSNCQIQP